MSTSIHKNIVTSYQGMENRVDLGSYIIFQNIIQREILTMNIM